MASVQAEILVMMITTMMSPAASQGLYTLDINAKSSEGIFVTYFQVKITFLLPMIHLNSITFKQTDGYAKISSHAEFNGTVDPEKWPQGLFSFTTCLR